MFEKVAQRRGVRSDEQSNIVGARSSVRHKGCESLPMCLLSRDCAASVELAGPCGAGGLQAKLKAGEPENHLSSPMFEPGIGKTRY